MLESVIHCLRHNDDDFLTQMEKSYNNIDGFGDESSSPPSNISIGHIKADIQEKILSSSYLYDGYYDEHFRDFKNIMYINNEQEYDKRIVKNIFDSMIQCNYIEADMCETLFYEKQALDKKYLKYKKKYLRLKNKLNKYN